MNDLIAFMVAARDFVYHWAMTWDDNFDRQVLHDV